MDKLVLLGCGEYAKSVVDAIESQQTYEIVGFVANVNNGKTVKGLVK